MTNTRIVPAFVLFWAVSAAGAQDAGRSIEKSQDEHVWASAGTSVVMVRTNLLAGGKTEALEKKLKDLRPAPKDLESAVSTDSFCFWIVLESKNPVDLPAILAVFGGTKIKTVMLKVVADVAQDKSGLVATVPASGQKIRLLNREKKKYDEKKPPDVAGEIAAKLAQGVTSFHLRGEARGAKDGLVMDLDAADPGTPEKKP